MFRKTAYTLMMFLLGVLSAHADGELMITVESNYLSDGNWGYYIARGSKGPLFVSSNNYVYRDEFGRLMMGGLDGRRRELMPQTKRATLHAVNNDVYLYEAAQTRKIGEDGSLVPVDELVHVTGEVYFNLRSKTLVNPQASDRTNDALKSLQHIESPIVAREDSLVFFLANGNGNFATLFRYNTQTSQLETVIERVTDFAVHGNTLVAFALQSEHTKMFLSEFPGDFVVYDLERGEITYNSDRPLWDASAEYTISSFDLNASGRLVAFGGFFVYDGYKVEENRRALLHIDLSPEIWER